MNLHSVNRQHGKIKANIYTQTGTVHFFVNVYFQD